ncbi:MAG: shikimate dehydrogenase [Burkholderiaceae bacterium]
MKPVDKYAVVGHPIAHSRSPEIHAMFARGLGHSIRYERIEAPLEHFADTALALRDAGYKGLNVTLPFKLDAAKFATDLSARARLAGAVNTLRFDGESIFGDNTDGIGFVRDITERLRFPIKDASILILGAGGGVRGLVPSLLEAAPKWIAVANRTQKRAEELAEEFGIEAIHFDEIPAEHFDLVVNATTTGLHHAAPAIDPETFDDCLLAYDLVYAPQPTPFMALAQSGGARQVADGLGMLIEQAAESYQVWRGERPDTAAVYDELRRLIAAEALAAPR